MKKSLLLSIAVTALLAGFGLRAVGGHGHGGHGHGGHHGHGGWGHGGWRHHGWGWGGPRVGFGISVGGPGYVGTPVVDYLDDPYEWYWSRYPRTSWDAYQAWLETNAYRFRRPWSYYRGPGYYRRWKARPSIGFGIGFGI